MCSDQFEPNGAVHIETDRLILRPPQADDAEPMAALLDDYEVVKMLSWTPWPFTPDHARDYIAAVGGVNPAFDRPMTIAHRSHGLIGGAAFHWDDEMLVPEIGFWIGRPHWGQGYATEAAAAALRWARDGWGKRALASGHFADNAASARVLVKAGFLYTGDRIERPCMARAPAPPTRMMIWLA
jgi:RimJ/RimL family protein N-acetyltransferase